MADPRFLHSDHVIAAANVTNGLPAVRAGSVQAWARGEHVVVVLGSPQSYAVSAYTATGQKVYHREGIGGFTLSGRKSAPHVRASSRAGAP